jgi:phenylalanyl-tRNA synthetase alpha chain
MNAHLIGGDALKRALAFRDLTDPTHGSHAMQRILHDVTHALADAWGARLTLTRAHPVVSVDDNYDALLYPAEGIARDARYTRWVGEGALLRTQTSAMIPPLLRARAPDGVVDDELLACVGLVYRRDCIDRRHVGEPHQLDLWRLSRTNALGEAELHEMIALVIGAALPGYTWRSVDALHPYTRSGRQIDVAVDVDGEWIEVGECGLAHPSVLARAGIDRSRVGGLAMGLGLDRLLMIRKRLDDIRLLRAEDPRIASQMLDLAPYREVSRMPALRRDLSIVVPSERMAEELGDRVRAALGDDGAGVVEEISVVSETSHEALHPSARARLRTRSGQKNVLVRVVLRSLTHTLSDAEGNALRDRIYAAIHEGEVHEWTRKE